MNLGTSFEEFAYDFQLFGSYPQEETFDLERAMATTQGQQCFYRLVLYPNQELINEHITDEPMLFAFLVALIFLFTSSIFVFYDCIVSRRQSIITKQAMRTNAIVANLFPEGFRNRLVGSEASRLTTRGNILRLTSGSANSKTTADDSDPIADLFPECTCIFADIAGMLLSFLFPISPLPLLTSLLLPDLPI
jgi:hypothetical protein